jgi:hypothetical protein
VDDECRALAQRIIAALAERHVYLNRLGYWSAEGVTLTREPGLDVDRLARAIDQCSFYWIERPLGDDMVEATLDATRYAADIAREYAALASEDRP